MAYRKNDFENKEAMGKIIVGKSEGDDYIMDDSALVYKSPVGLVIITSCSHVGICSIIEYAKKICKDDKVTDIIGGFHLLNPSKEQLQGTLKYMKKLHPYKVHACHCTHLDSKIALSNVINLKDIGVGLKLEYK